MGPPVACCHKSFAINVFAFVFMEFRQFLKVFMACHKSSPGANHAKRGLPLPPSFVFRHITP
jgi:hypothetical protein